VLGLAFLLAGVFALLTSWHSVPPLRSSENAPAPNFGPNPFVPRFL
jgi:hypothetical protein